MPIAVKPPDQLTGDVVVEIVSLTYSTYGRRMPLAVGQALTRLLDSHRAHDARDVAHTCEAAGSPGLAAALDQALLGARK
jgi:hypothetical protein